MEAAGTRRALCRQPEGHTGPEDIPPGQSRRAGWIGGLRAGQAFRMGPQAAPASDAKSPAGIGSDAGGAP